MSRILGNVAVLLTISVTFGVAHAAAAILSIRAVEGSLEAGTPQATLEKYFSCEHYEGSAYQAIASGSPKWIKLAERMLQYSDACYTEGIQNALGEAMQRSAKDVLPLVDKQSLLAANAICLPFISAEAPLRLQLAEVKKSKASVRRVHDNALKAQRASCLAIIKSAENNIRSQTSTKGAP